MQLLLDNEQEYQLVAQHLHVNNHEEIVYAVKDTHAAEWNDTRLILIELSIGFV